MKYKNTTVHTIMVPHAGSLTAVLGGDVVELPYCSIAGMSEVRQAEPKKPVKRQVQPQEKR